MTSPYTFSGKQIPAPPVAHGLNSNIPENKQMPMQMYGQKTLSYPTGNNQVFSNAPSHISSVTRLVPNMMPTPLKLVDIAQQKPLLQEAGQHGQPSQALNHDNMSSQNQDANVLSGQNGNANSAQNQIPNTNPIQNQQSHVAQEQTSVRYQNSPSQAFVLPRGQFDQRNQYEQMQRGQFEQRNQFDQRNQFEQRNQFDQRGQFDQRSQFDQRGQLGQFDQRFDHRFEQRGQFERPHNRDESIQNHQFGVAYSHPEEHYDHADFRYHQDGRMVQNSYSTQKNGAFNYIGHGIGMQPQGPVNSMYSQPQTEFTKPTKSPAQQTPYGSSTSTPISEVAQQSGALEQEKQRQSASSSVSLSSGHEETPSSGTSAAITTIKTKFVSAIEGDGTKRKRGRPKKFILDPSTNQYIDSSHENYKRLNRLHKESIEAAGERNTPKDSATDFIAKGTNLGSLNDQAVKQLLEKKDRRGRPRKFPIEQTGVTIKGVRVNGSLKRRKPSSPSLDADGNKRKRGRPKREPETPELK
ncbi:hypothetical protein A9F13_26g00429 [Clavispora lusitaniae]|uniref:Uncharacterized protein n=1 Tax=Clavispora lusitaniae TaxID=36911 RepID=A0AA91PV58_CLALS|nr:hypothetical protein A9F13_26g00429 [Clavispora lusitaniae]